MQIIALDTSLNSTACTVFDKNSNYHFLSWRKNLAPDNIWNKSMKFVQMFNVNYQTSTNFTESEVLKLEDYLTLASDVFNKTANLLDKNLPVKVLIEGYSQKSKGQDHDLVCYGTLIRLKMYSNYGNLNIIPPKSLKKFAAQIAYPQNVEGKKTKVWRNNDGIPGGSFDKHQMFNAIVDYNQSDLLSKWCKLNWKDIKDKSAVPKPADDLNDSFWLCEVGKLNLI